MVIQEKIAAYSAATPASAFRVAIGLNTGDPIHEEGDIYGTAVITASRVADLALGEQILATDVVRLLSAGKGFCFEPIGNRVVAGLAEPLSLYEVGWRTALTAQAIGSPPSDEHEPTELAS
jgi:class 3 adenylate cyclase